MPDDGPYTLTRLADLAGVSPRTVRYYLSQGLLPAVGLSGPGAKYGPGHLARLRLIRRLQAEHLPLAEIRRRLDALDDDAVRELADVARPAPPVDSALEYVRSVLAGASASVGPPRYRASSSLLRRMDATDPIAPARPARGLALTSAPMPHAEALADEPSPSTVPPVSGPAAAASERSQWERIALAPDVELHLRRPLTRSVQKSVDRLVMIARELLEEDPA